MTRMAAPSGASVTAANPLANGQNWLSLALTAFVLFLVVDWVAWDGYYRHGFFARLNRQAQIWTEETGHF